MNAPDMYSQFPMVSDSFFQPDNIFELDQPLKSNGTVQQQHTSSLLDLGSGMIKEEAPVYSTSFPSYSTYNFIDSQSGNSSNNNGYTEMDTYSRHNIYVTANNNCDNTRSSMGTYSSKRPTTKSACENMQFYEHPITSPSDEYSNDFYKFECTNYKSHRRKNECAYSEIQSNPYLNQPMNSVNQCDSVLSFNREHLLNDYMLPVVPLSNNNNQTYLC